MAVSDNVLAFVMAGGEGSRLRPLTSRHCKPAVPFNARHRIVDFVLSNLANSDITETYMLVQYKAESLVEHVQRTWNGRRGPAGTRVNVLPPRAGRVFEGTADAVYQNIDLIRRQRPDVVVIFGADHIYRMDVRQMVDFHRASGAAATVAALPVPLAKCYQFGIVEADSKARITDFKEKPKSVRPMPGSDTHALASMGNYVFDTEVLLATLDKAHAEGATDFGKDILPRMVQSHHLAVYDFHTNYVPGVAPFEEHGYWRDVGTLDAYFQAQLDTLGAKPRFRMHNPLWPIHTGSLDDEIALADGKVQRSMVGAGSLVDGATLDMTLVRGGVRVERGAWLDRCIVMDGARIGCGAQLRRVIIDQDNDVPALERIGMDAEKDRQRFDVTSSGIVVVPAGFFPPRAAAPSFVAPQRTPLAGGRTPAWFGLAA